MVVAENYLLALRTYKDQSFADRDLKQVIFSARQQVID